MEILSRDIDVEEKTRLVRQVDQTSRAERVRERLADLVKASADPRIKESGSAIRLAVGEAKSAKGPFEPPGLSALIIDDLTYITKTISYALIKEGFRVATAKSGIDGIIQFQSMLPQVVITDIRLPDFNGFEIAGMMRELDESVPIVFITASDIDEEKYARIAGAKAYLQKPIMREDLLEAVHKLLDAEPR